MASLYAMKQEYLDLLGQLEEAPEDAEQILGQIEALQEDVGDKAEAYARIIQGKEREAEMYDAEIRRLQLLKSRALGVVDRLKGNLLDAMLSVDASEIRTSIGKWKLRTNPASVRVLDDRQIPPEYLTPQPPKVDKRAILKAFSEDGEIIPGTEIVKGKRVEFK